MSPINAVFLSVPGAAGIAVNSIMYFSLIILLFLLGLSLRALFVSSFILSFSSSLLFLFFFSFYFIFFFPLFLFFI